MKTSLLTKKASSRRTLLIRRFILIVIFALLSVLSVVILPVVARGIATVVWYPFDVVRVWVAESGSSLPQYIRERRTLLGELEAYKVADATSRGNESTIKKLQIENDEFRKQLGAVPEERLLARVVARPNQLPYDMLMLDRGSNHGVVIDAPVFVGKDQVIGFVSAIHAETSLVTLLSTPGFTASAYVFGPNIYTVTEGMGGGVLRVRVPQGILLQPHNIVVLPAIDSGVYGEVAYVEAAPSQPEQYGYVRTSIPLQSLYYVSIGRQPIVTHSFDDAKTVVADTANKLFSVAVPASELVVPESYKTTEGTSSVSTASSAATSTTGARATTTH